MKHVRAAIGAALLLVLGLGSPAAGASPLDGTRTLFATLADGSRLRLGTVSFGPVAAGRQSFRLALDTTVFTDHFLSMREFKCLPGGTELSCHVPYPYVQPGTIGDGDYAWLEHSLLFFYKRPSEFGARLWNGIYFEFRPTPSGLVGTPKAVDLDRIGAPPADLSVPPLRPALRDEMRADARWLRSLSLE